MRDEAVIVFCVSQYAFLFKTVHQGDIERIGHGFGGFPGNGVGIGIQDMSLPSCVKGAMTGTMPLRTRSARSVPLTASTSPTKP